MTTPDPEAKAMDMNNFNEWALTVDALCRAHLACGWRDLCGDRWPLEAAFDASESPMEFVRWLAEKYDLEWRSASGVI
ncbi:MAG: hypothetical protein LAO77_15275 [Acidobacteriia bacterium]|nr:hypothetical protein [Terriglobia bacterium]